MHRRWVADGGGPVARGACGRFLGATAPTGAATSRPLTATRRLATTSEAPLKRTGLHGEHMELGARLVPFCGWDMPVQYREASIIDSHLHTRAHAGLFDVSHMGQLKLHGRDRVEFLEGLVVGDLRSLPTDHARLSLFTNDQGGIKDDTVITNGAEWLYAVINAGCVDKDLPHIEEHLSRFKARGKDVSLEVLSEYSLVALQGPEAATVLGEHVAGGPEALRSLSFMSGRDTRFDSLPIRITRCGYTGEDGFEISVATRDVVPLWRALLQHQGKVLPVGLAARDSLRLEAGLCLYGNDITEETSPVEAGLTWTIGKRRRAEGGFPGSDVILRQIKEGVTRKRAGFVLAEGIARAHATAHDGQGELLGEVTSGSYAPSLKQAVGMVYLPSALAKTGTQFQVQVRKKFYPATVASMPFHPTNYYKP